MFNLFQLLYIIFRLLFSILRLSGISSIVAENIILKQQLIILSRNKKRCPNLSNSDRLIFGFLSKYINFKRLTRIAVLVKPATLIKLHKLFVSRKYKSLFSKKSHKKPGRKGLSQEMIELILKYKTLNPRFGYLRIAMQISNQFGIEISSDTVRRVLNRLYKPDPNKNRGPSWLSFLGHTKDSLWSIDFFRTESIHLKSNWVMVIMDQFTRKIVGFAVHNGDMNGSTICCMFNSIILKQKLPKRISTDNDPLFEFQRWQANLRILEIEHIKSIPYTPISHPFVERLIRTIREELLNNVLVWNAGDLQKKLDAYKDYFNHSRAHAGINAMTPENKSSGIKKVLSLNNFKWQKHLHGLVHLPIAV